VRRACCVYQNGEGRRGAARLVFTRGSRREMKERAKERWRKRGKKTKRDSVAFGFWSRQSERETDKKRYACGNRRRREWREDLVDASTGRSSTLLCRTTTESSGWTGEAARRVDPARSCTPGLSVLCLPIGQWWRRRELRGGQGCCFRISLCNDDAFRSPMGKR